MKAILLSLAKSIVRISMKESMRDEIMAVYKEDSGNWYVSKRYIDLEGKKKRLFKRGFKTKHEALLYEQSFMSKEKDDQTMLFDDFVEVYYEELKNRIRLSTFITKQNCIL